METPEALPTLKFEFTIAFNNSITITHIAIEGVPMDLTTLHLDADGKNLIGIINAFVATLHFALIIDATGEIDNETTFSLTCDGDKVVIDNPNITIGNTGFGGFAKSNIPLP